MERSGISVRVHGIVVLFLNLICQPVQEVWNRIGEIHEHLLMENKSIVADCDMLRVSLDHWVDLSPVAEKGDVPRCVE